MNLHDLSNTNQNNYKIMAYLASHTRNSFVYRIHNNVIEAACINTRSTWEPVNFWPGRHAQILAIIAREANELA